MNSFFEHLSELQDTLEALNNEVATLNYEVANLKEMRKNTLKILNTEDIMKITGWSRKTAQKAMQDPRMRAIWIGKGPQVTPKEFERYCSLGIDRSTDPYWKN